MKNKYNSYFKVYKFVKKKMRVKKKLIASLTLSFLFP